MIDKIKRFTFYNIFFLCAFLGLFMVLNLKSYADTLASVEFWGGGSNNVYYQQNIVTFHYNENNRRIALLKLSNNGNVERYRLYSNSYNGIEAQYYIYGYDWSTGAYNPNYNSTTISRYFSTYNIVTAGVYADGNYSNSQSFINDTTRGSFVSNLIVFDNEADIVNYILNGVVPEVPFDETLKLDSFKITSWQVGTLQAAFRSKLEVTWSDSRIANVQVRVVGSANSPATFEGNTSPFKQKFYAQNYVMKNGDVIHFTATPFKSNGEYGESLYYSLVYNDHLPSNWYRKLVNTPYNDNTLTIPYNDVSGQPQSVTLPVDGVTTNNVYKVNYNPVTYKYGDLNLYNIYYSPVLVYPEETPESEIDDTQEVVNNTYTTNNYYATTKNFNIDFDVSFGDISGNDIKIGYDNTGNFLNSFGKIISKLSTWVLALFPFLPPIVATSIVVVFGLVVSVAIIAFVLKIASVIANFLDAIIPG